MKTYRILSLYFLTLLISVQSFAQDDPIHLTINAFQADSLIRQYADSSNFVILDLRTPGEFETGYIEGAINLNYYDDLFEESLAILDRSKVYLIYCAGGGRSGAVFNMMIALNFQVIYNLQGGISAWVNAGFPVIISTGIEDVDLAQRIITYPNPASDFINLELNSIPSGSILHIFDAQGRCVWEDEIKHPSTTKTISVNNWSKGLYIINLINPHGQKQSRKILIN